MARFGLGGRGLTRQPSNPTSARIVPNKKGGPKAAPVTLKTDAPCQVQRRAWACAAGLAGCAKGRRR
jgi:hypothetical protein